MLQSYFGCVNTVTHALVKYDKTKGEHLQLKALFKELMQNLILKKPQCGQSVGTLVENFPQCPI